MNLRLFPLLIVSLIGVLPCPQPLRAAAPESIAPALLQELLRTREAILAARPIGAAPIVFLAFWDFDGTLLRGDCSEGLTENGRPLYAGLAQVTIEHGLSKIYPATGGFVEFWKDYRYIDHRIGNWLSFPYIPQMLRGARVADVESIARAHFAAILAPYFYTGSLRILHGLEAAGVENHVMSGAADVFIKASNVVLGLPTARFHGIAVRIDEEGRMTSDVIPPLTWADGKRAKLLEVVAATRAAHPGAEIVILAAFGNSFVSDGPFLEYTAQQRLPTGQPGVGVMINGGTAPRRYRGAFREITLQATLQ